MGFLANFSFTPSDPKQIAVPIQKRLMIVVMLTLIVEHQMIMVLFPPKSAHSKSAVHPITLFYDGACPLCAWEISHLQRWNSQGQVRFVDLTDGETPLSYPEVDIVDAQRVLLAIDSKGEKLRGIDATNAIWVAVGKGLWMAPLRWRLTRPLASWGYALFAKHRHAVAAYLARILPTPTCNSGCHKR